MGSAASATVAPRSLVVAQITSVEIISALARQMREGHITPAEVRKLRLWIDTHFALEYLVIDLSPDIARRSQDLLLAHPLRAFDAVQLASALDNAARLTAAGLDTPVFVSADRRLLAAAAAEGLATDDPNAH